MAPLNTDQRQWLADLRSGDYPQGRQRMKVNGKFCCMGVAAQRHGILVKDEKPWYDDADANMFGVCQVPNGGVQHSYLPDWLNAKLGLSHDDNNVLASLNDEHNFSFHQIAEFCEQCWMYDVGFYVMREYLRNVQQQMMAVRRLANVDPTWVS